jgi:hypothetical protein
MPIEGLLVLRAEKKRRNYEVKSFVRVYTGLKFTVISISGVNYRDKGFVGRRGCLFSDWASLALTRVVGEGVNQLENKHKANTRRA